MKKYLIVLYCLLNIIFTSCEPDIVGEGINLPPMEFGFKVYPDTAYLKVGDTITLSASISSILNNGVKINDGKATIKIGNSYSSETPIIDENTFRRAKNEIDFICIAIDGGILIQENTFNLYHLYAYPSSSDSIKIKINFIPLKRGTYSFDLTSLFFEGSQGKTRTNPYFNIQDNHGELLWQVPNMPAIQPGNPSYNKHYYFAVTD